MSQCISGFTPIHSQSDKNNSSFYYEQEGKINKQNSSVSEESDADQIEMQEQLSDNSNPQLSDKQLQMDLTISLKGYEIQNNMDKNELTPIKRINFEQNRKDSTVLELIENDLKGLTPRIKQRHHQDSQYHQELSYKAKAKKLRQQIISKINIIDINNKEHQEILQEKNKTIKDISFLKSAISYLPLFQKNPDLLNKQNTTQSLFKEFSYEKFSKHEVIFNFGAVHLLIPKLTKDDNREEKKPAAIKKGKTLSRNNSFQKLPQETLKQQNSQQQDSQSNIVCEKNSTAKNSLAEIQSSINSIKFENENKASGWDLLKSKIKTLNVTNKSKFTLKQQIDDDQVSDNEEDEASFLKKYFEDMNLVKTFIAGEAFGEIALMTKQRRTGTMICKEDTHLMTLTKSGFDKILGEFHEQIKSQRLGFLKQFDFFESIPNSNILSILLDISIVTLPKKSILYNQNEQSGEIQISRSVYLNESEPPIESKDKSQSQQKGKAISPKDIIFKKYHKREICKKQRSKYKNVILTTQGSSSHFGCEDLMEHLQNNLQVNNLSKHTFFHSNTVEIISQTAEVYILNKNIFINNLYQFRAIGLFVKELSRKVIHLEQRQEQVISSLEQTQKKMEKLIKKVECDKKNQEEQFMFQNSQGESDFLSASYNEINQSNASQLTQDLISNRLNTPYQDNSFYSQNVYLRDSLLGDSMFSSPSSPKNSPRLNKNNSNQQGTFQNHLNLSMISSKYSSKNTLYSPENSPRNNFTQKNQQLSERKKNQIMLNGEKKYSSQCQSLSLPLLKQNKTNIQQSPPKISILDSKQFEADNLTQFKLTKAENQFNQRCNSQNKQSRLRGNKQKFHPEQNQLFNSINQNSNHSQVHNSYSSFDGIQINSSRKQQRNQGLHDKNLDLDNSQIIRNKINKNNQHTNFVLNTENQQSIFEESCILSNEIKKYTPRSHILELTDLAFENSIFQTIRKKDYTPSKQQSENNIINSLLRSKKATDLIRNQFSKQNIQKIFSEEIKLKSSLLKKFQNIQAGKSTNLISTFPKKQIENIVDLNVNLFDKQSKYNSIILNQQLQQLEIRNNVSIAQSNSQNINQSQATPNKNDQLKKQNLGYFNFDNLDQDQIRTCKLKENILHFLSCKSKEQADNQEISIPNYANSLGDAPINLQSIIMSSRSETERNFGSKNVGKTFSKRRREEDQKLPEIKINASVYTKFDKIKAETTFDVKEQKHKENISSVANIHTQKAKQLINQSLNHGLAKMIIHNHSIQQIKKQYSEKKIEKKINDDNQIFFQELIK